MHYAQATHHGPAWDKNGHVIFRLWAPSASSVYVIVDDAAPALMNRGENGWVTLKSETAKPGSQYCFMIDGDLRVPDPASRFQPVDVAGMSELIDPNSFEWTADQWNGRPWSEAVIYELHVGCFTKEGNYRALEAKLDHLVALGVTAIELMPIADFAGKRGWGYDGVLPYAPATPYGRPEDLKRLIAAAHARNLMVFLDVVYNHFGPSGNFLHVYAKHFFNEHEKTPWGAAINFQESQEVRDFFIDNALYWLNEYRFDGLRFDAVHAIVDHARESFLKELAASVRKQIPAERHVHLILENDRNEARYLERDRAQKTEHFTAQWNDDIHHVLHVLTSGEQFGYYGDYSKQTLQQLGRCLSEGFAYQGEVSDAHNGEIRGEKSAHLPPAAFVSFLQNHDQIGNRALGDRLSALAEKDRLTLVMTILLLSPQVPMLFMGEEWATQTPFLYFCDFEGELADAVREGRRREFSGFPAFSDPESQQKIPDPNNMQTYVDSTLDWNEKSEAMHAEQLAFTQTLLAVRHRHIVPLVKTRWIKSSYATIGEQGLDVRWQFEGGELQLATNFSDESLTFDHNSGERIWGNFDNELPAWQCMWSIKHG